MKKYILICCLCTAILVGCGITSSSNEEVSKHEKESSASVSMDSSPTDKQTVDITDSEVRASAVVQNIDGGFFSGMITDGDAFYNYVRSIMENSRVDVGSGYSRVLNVGFMAGDDKYVLSHCHGDLFGLKDMSSNKISYFQPDTNTAENLRDMMLTYSAVENVFGKVSCSVSDEHTETSLVVQAADEIPEAYSEIRTYYVNEDTVREVLLETEGEAVSYIQQEPSKYYEFLADGNGTSYYRNEEEALYYPSDGFTGDMLPLPLAKSIISQQYLYSYSVNVDGAEDTVEVWQNGDALCYVLLDGSDICAMWEYIEDKGAALMTSLKSGISKSGSIALKMDEASENQGVLQDGIPTFRRHDTMLEYDTERYGLFDLSGGVKIGEIVEPTGVVEEWRDYISSQDKPFTLIFRWAGAGRTEYQISTTDGKDFYYRHEMELHKDDDDLGSEEICVDGRVYSSVYYLKEYSDRQFTELPKDPEYESYLVTDLLFENEKLDEDYKGTCEKAYKVTVNGEEYICEEWSLYLDRLWKVYIKDGKIVAWEGDFYNEPTVNTIITLEKTADESLIKAPENSKKYVSND